MIDNIEKNNNKNTFCQKISVEKANKIGFDTFVSKACGLENVSYHHLAPLQHPMSTYWCLDN